MASRNTDFHKMGYYGTVTNADIIAWCQPLFVPGGGYYLRDSDGKICHDPKGAWNTPWHHVRHANRFDCHLWHRIMFDTVQANYGGPRFVPSFCQDCWKVVVRPRTLKELFALLDFQKHLDLPSKCGMENRDYVHGNYGGYFYNVGIDAGLDCLERVQAEIAKWPGLGPEIPTILKRACTEYEMECGPSDQWEVGDWQMHVESVVYDSFHSDIINRTQPEWAIKRVHRSWIEHAYSIGDETYEEFTNGQRLYHPYVTYNHMLEERSKERSKQG